MPRMPERYVAFPEANYSVLTQIAAELGVEIVEDRNVNMAQELFKKGAKIPGIDLEPRETWMLDQIMKVVTPKNIPPKLIVYLNDRKHADIEELDVPTVLARQTQVAFKNLVSGVNAVNDGLKKLE
jgi:hypothetical protein